MNEELKIKNLQLPQLKPLNFQVNRNLLISMDLLLAIGPSASRFHLVGEFT